MTLPIPLTNAVDDSAPGAGDGTPIVAGHLNQVEAAINELHDLVHDPESIEPGHKTTKLWTPDGSLEVVTTDDEGRASIGAESPIPQSRLTVVTFGEDNLAALFINPDFNGINSGSGIYIGMAAPSGDVASILQALVAGGQDVGNLILNPLGGKIGIGKYGPNSALAVAGLPIYADNAAALADGLTEGDFYRTATGVLMVTYSVE